MPTSRTDRLNYVVGIDAGTTKTDAVVANLEGRPLGAGSSGCANWEVVGEKGAADALEEAIRRALGKAAADLTSVRHVHIGAAGLDWPEDEARLRNALAPFLRDVPLTLENDSYLGARACAPAAHGITVSAGSGVCASYLGAGGEKYFYGYFGELGGGTAIDQLTLHAILRAEDGRGPKTELTSSIPKATGHASVQDLLHALTRKGYVLAHTVIRPSLFDTAARGDPVAIDVVTTFGRELGLMATNLIMKFRLKGNAPCVIASGSLFTRTGPLLFDVFRRVVHGADDSAVVRLNDRPPVAGAVRVALSACGLQTNGNWESISSSYQGALHA
ncbi:MAG TPA: BadF/BadG/BcrA/BcrD ATPase family protein [Polyangiaceae bacterium]|nr:BadF/BadG/BcrA/BcrD ATPase family protein [Polyangiaceae bacterium]